MKIIVTGGAGFIGSHLVRRLLKDGHDVIVIDNLSTGCVGYVPKQEKVTFLKIDISSYQKLISKMNYFKDVDVVFHLAAQARIQPSIAEPTLTFNSNATGTLNILQMMRKVGIKNIIYSSTSSSYGKKAKMPCREDMPPDCLTPYAATKYAAELMCKAWGTCYGLNTICLKYFNVYGIRSPERGAYAPVVGLFFKQALKEKKHLTIIGDGEQRRDYTFVDDIVEGNIKAMNKLINNPESVNGFTFNLGCGRNYSINEMAKIVLDSLHIEKIAEEIAVVHIPERPAESRETLADITLAKDLLEWEPKVNLKEGIDKIKKHYIEKYGYFLLKDKPYERRGISYIFDEK
jgi:nucleoside-diphosphate-sugar epimerase